MTTPLKTPVAFIIFNRPDCTRRVFERIRQARPEKLYLIADAPRPHKAGEAERCAETRRIVEGMIDWPCEVHKNYAEKNLGCRMRPATGISWVFEHEEKAIILEDDCLPDPSFFPFCQAMLERYSEHPDVMLVCGTNSKKFRPKHNESYFFSRYSQTWGWATWKRAWDLYDIKLREWESIKMSSAWEEIDIAPEARSFYEMKLEEITREGLDAWDYGWSMTIALNSGKAIIPAHSLIENIGFGQSATHTINPIHKVLQPEVRPIEVPYTHPETTAWSDAHDNAYAKSHYGNPVIKLREKLFKFFMR